MRRRPRAPGDAATRRRLVAGLAELGASLRAERSVEDVHARVREELARLGAVSVLVRAGDGRSRIVWTAAPEARRREFAALAGAQPEGFAGPTSDFARRVLADGCAFVEDWGAHAPSYLPAAPAGDVRRLVDRAGFSRTAAVRIDAPREEGLYLAIASPVLRSDDLPAVRLFGAQVSSALAATRTIADLSRRNAHLAVLARVAELAGAVSDLPAFFAGAAELVRPVVGCVGLAVFVVDEAAQELALVHLDRTAPAGLEGRIRRIPLATPLGEVVRTRVARVTALPYPGATPEILSALPYGAMAWVPLVARSRGVGALAAAFDAGEETASASLELLTSVGAHFAGAVESHALLGTLRRRVEEQTRLFADAERRLADLEAVHALTLRVFANDPGDLGALLQDACAELRRALSAQTAAVYLTAEDPATLRAAAFAGVTPPHEALVIDLRGQGLAARAMRARSPMQTEDVSREPRSGRFDGAEVPRLAMLAIPLVSRKDVRGLVFVADGAGRRFGPGDLAVANALAGALGVGVENADLYAEARRQVEELSAVNEASRAIAGSLDLDEVLRQAAKAARRAVGTPRAFVVREDPLTGALSVAGGAGVDPAALRGVEGPIPAGTPIEQVLRERRAERLEDTAASEAGRIYERRFGGRALVAVPVLLRGEPLGVLVVDDPAGPRAFSAPDLERLTAVADRLAVAAENARLFLEARRRAEEMGLLHEVGRSLVESLDLERVLSGGVQSLARIVDASAAYLSLATPDGSALVLRAHAGDARARLGTRLPARPPSPAIASLVYHLREPVLVGDASTDPRVTDEMRRLTGARAYLGLPLVVHDRVIGTVVIVETRGPRVFTPAEAERAAAVANQLAVAVENARLYEDLRRSYAALGRAQQRLVQGERLAALGEMSAVVAHEVRNPLGVIFNSVGSLRRLVRPTGDARTLFDIVEEEADRLNRIVGDLLDFARPSTPDFRPEDLGRVAEEAVAAAVQPGAGRIEVVRELDPGLPPVPVDARLVRQAVLNVAVNAVQAMPRGGRLTVRARLEATFALVEIEDTGAGIPDEVRERMFEPFFTTKASGTGLGLAVVRRIVEGHGGEVHVRSVPGAGTTFALRFPLDPGDVENDPAMR